ncbi:MAG TPA: zeta toxin family protein [Kofleriaceae bacterium]|nr:zeta toxin family protein [Kofleriaceae bacterium]
MTPQLVMLAGPNGAGKSTYYDAFLADSPLPFLNADLFAAETGVDSFEAARVLDATRDRMIEDRLGFITETVFSDPYGEKLAMLRKASDAGFDVTLIYIGLANPELSARRVDQRIAHGGHDVPRDRLASRYERSLANLREAITFVPSVELFDNSLVERPYRHVATFKFGALARRAPGRVPAWCKGIVIAKRRWR